MEQRNQDFVVTGQRDSLGPRPLEHVEQAAVLLVEVEVGGRQPVQRTPEVAGDRDGLQEDLGHDHRAAEVEPDSSGHPRDQRRRACGSRRAPLAQRGPIECRASCGRCRCRWRRGRSAADSPRRAATSSDESSPGPPCSRTTSPRAAPRPSRPRGGARAGRGEEVRCLAGEAERAGHEPGCRRPRWSCRRSPARGRGSPPSRSRRAPGGCPGRSSRSGTEPQPVLTTWPPSAATIGRPRVVGADDRVPQPLERGRAQQPGQGFEPVAELRVRRGRATQVGERNLARPLGQRLEAQVVQVERREPLRASVLFDSDPFRLTRNPFRAARPDVGREEAGPGGRP